MPVSQHVPPATRSRGFTLIEAVVVMSLLMVLLLIIAATLWGAVKIERADSALLHRITVQAQLADRFRQDVSQSIERPTTWGDQRSGPDCLILRKSEDQLVIYRWSEERLIRREIQGESDSMLPLAVGGEHVEVQFEWPAERVAKMVLIESRGVGKSRRLWPLEVSATLGGDRQ
jgi:type II secretory pathway pseudopilin PulG